ncbi:hypothetical protein CCHL11_03893 [Colletotrichum chlorophyti]|uniref:Uncharacterized protein n=1 Tax=Colletotrichum chlorophyti TaxID=708187 RepID=A0A1Q8RKN1_9PEZI|nr:hypothetical protein CCHL11_03893 [Colletotrichum chlorophyti]
MTKSLRGSSLPQARSYHHNHYHLHNKRAAAAAENPHHHQHRQVDEASPDPTPTPTPTTTDKVAESSTAPPRIVVQTVSLIQIVDASGVPLGIQTIYPTQPSATVLDESTSSTALGFSIAALPSDSPTPLLAPQASSTSNDDIFSAPPSTTPSSADPYASQDIPLTSDLSSSVTPSSAAPSPYPTLSAASNSTIPFLTSSNSSSTSVFTTTDSSTQRSSDSTSSTSSLLSSLSSTSTSSSSSTGLSTSTFTTTVSSTLSADPTASGDGTIGGAGAGGADQPTATSSTTGNSDNDNTSTPTGTVVGSVVGSLAGAAFLMVLVFLALRWRKRSGGRFRLSDSTAGGKRGILNGTDGRDGSNGGGMVQRSLSFGPTAAAAGVAGAATAAAATPSSRMASEPPETAEKGFVKVAGRKLPSVLQSGGDGYTDPREGAANDDESVYFRDSQAFFDPNGATTLPNGQPRLALGSPMRPVSGVVIVKDGPARTPVTESAPFPDTKSTFFPLQPPARDPIGRTLTSQDGSRVSRGSGSKFTEDM